MSVSRTSVRTNSDVSAFVVSPGPMATASNLPRPSRTTPMAEVATAPSAVSGSGRNVASVIRRSATGRIPSGTATVTRPAPARYALSATRRTAPVIRRDPAITNTTPLLRLWPPGSRFGHRAATSERSISSRSLCTRSAGKPMSTTWMTPAHARPGWNNNPGFAAPNVTVAVARTAAPSTAPDSPSTPEGMSTATTGRPEALSASMASGASPSGTPRNPVPKMASIATSERASSRSSAASRRTRPPASSKIRSIVEDGSRSVAASGNRITVGRTPHRARCRAATNPSPPLFPFPHTMVARRPYTPPSATAADRATARPADSINCSTVIPRSRLCRSSSEASAGVRIGLIPDRLPARDSTQPRDRARARTTP